ncbi:MAG: hypothetical protein K1X75_12555 [Leptospirales bacterium]|nr:hypothetical protein [Leptospirales bacterium]
MPEQSLSAGMMLTRDIAKARRNLPHSIDFWSCAVYRNTAYGPQCASYLRRPVPFDIDEME